MNLNAGSAAASAIGTGIGAIETIINDLNTYMAIRDAARVSAQNQPTWEYEDAIEDIHANRLMQAAYEEQQRARNTQQLVLQAREILRRVRKSNS